MTQLEQALTYLEEHQGEMKQLWETIVRMESPSANADAVTELAKYLEGYCRGFGLDAERFSTEGVGDSLCAQNKSKPLAPIMLLGHLDTVHPVGSFPTGPWTEKDGFVSGPGAHDCKGGVAIATFVMKALLHAGYDKRQLRMLMVSDEEAAHTLSHGKTVEYLNRKCQDCAAVFTVESGLMNGSVTTGRKGGGIMKLTVEGIASHAGIAPEKGASAIWEAARKIVAIQALSDPKVVTYNCGIIHGGTSANVVPDHCEVSVAIRYYTNQACTEALAKLQSICNTVETPGTRCTLGPLVGFPAMEKTEKTAELFRIYRDSSVAADLGTPEENFAAGCSDSAYTTSAGVPTLCAVGVQGEGQHSANEHAIAASLLPQAKRIVAAILALPDSF